MAKTYTLNEIKKLVLDEANATRGLTTSFTPVDADKAYNEAVRECGFELPSATDADAQVKYQWLIQRMRRWYLYQLQQQNILNFDIGDLRRGQISKVIAAKIQDMDNEFKMAKDDPSTAHIFTSAGKVFGEDMVIASGFLENKIGEDVSYVGQTSSTTKNKQPTATENAINKM